MKSTKAFIYSILLLTAVSTQAQVTLGSNPGDTVLPAFFGQNTNADAIIDGLNKNSTIPLTIPSWPASLNTNRAWIVNALGTNNADLRQAATLQFCQTNIAIGETAYVFPGGYTHAWTNQTAILYCAEGAQVYVGATNGTIIVRGRGTVQALGGKNGFYDIDCLSFIGFGFSQNMTGNVHCVNARIVNGNYSDWKTNYYNIIAEDTIRLDDVDDQGFESSYGQGPAACMNLKAHKVVMTFWLGTEEDGIDSGLLLCGDSSIYTDVLITDVTGYSQGGYEPVTWIDSFTGGTLKLQAHYVESATNKINAIHFQLPVKLLGAPTFEQTPVFGTTHSGTYQ